jgi:PiT family inorganic phosphate transporter
MMTFSLFILIFAVVVGFYMAWNIGANDVANAMGTSVGSGALTLRRAVVIAAVFEFLGALLAGSHVSETVMKGIVKSSVFADDPYILAYGMIAALLGSGAWLQVASYYGWPVSTTHSIIGAVAGFGAIYGGLDAVQWDKMAYIAASWVISPLMGGALAYIVFTVLNKLIFFKMNPSHAARKTVPIVVFSAVLMLTYFFLIQGLKNLELPITHLEGIALCLFLASSTALFAFSKVRKIEVCSLLPPDAKVDPQMVISLEKAAKHLFRAKQSAAGENRFQMGMMIDELQELTHSLKQQDQLRTSSSEYLSVEKMFGYLQILSASTMAFAHGANDVANAIGPLAAVVQIISVGTIPTSSVIPIWILALGGIGIVMGLATWGWRVILTIGSGITELTPSRGFSAECGAAATILLASRLGLPISTTHTLVGAVLGVGLARGIGALNLNTLRDIVISWIITVPAGAIMAVIIFKVMIFFLV